jgi:4-amino-4-deoxy-L-arabinose transferase-like glycosyltransferase
MAASPDICKPKGARIMNARRFKPVEIALAVLILLFSIALRINAPSADLPSHITFSGSILTDEGNQCHNSRSKALFDQWFPDDWRITNYNPVLPWIKYTIFKIFGVGIWQMRLFSHIFAVLSLLIFFLTLRSFFREDYIYALLGTLLLGINFLYVMYNKIGTFETSITFWVILTLYFLEKYRSDRKRFFLFLCGASAFMAFIFKSIMAYLLPLPFAAYVAIHIFAPGEEKGGFFRAIQNLLIISAGMLVLFLPWYVTHYLPNREWILSAPGQYMGNLMFPRSLEAAFRNFLSFPWKEQFFKIPVVWLGAVLSVPMFVRRLVRRRGNLLELGFFLFFLAHTAVFLFMSYRPTRYFLPVIPAMVFMTVLLFRRWAQNPHDSPVRFRLHPVDKSFLFVTDTLWLSLASYFCLIPLFSRYIYHVPLPELSPYYIMASAILVAIAHGLRDLYRKFIWQEFNLKYLLVPVIVLLVFFSVTTNLRYYLNWNNTRTYSVYNMSRELGEKLENAYIGGMTSTVAVLENKHRALWLYPNFVNWDADTFKKYPMTHALLGTDVSREIIHFFKQWPERMNRASLQKIYPLKDYNLFLYSFISPYIVNCRKEEIGDNKVSHSYRLTLNNPSSNPIKTSVGYIWLSRKGQNGQEKIVKIHEGLQSYDIPAGSAEIVVQVTGEAPENADSLFFYLDYPHPFKSDKPNALRIEGENLPGKTGRDRLIADASNGKARVFSRTEDTPGFISYGPAVPFGRGILMADFKVTIDNPGSKIRPVCRLDIFSYAVNEPVTQTDIKASDARKNKTGLYRLATIVKTSRKLEFRVQVTQPADIQLDYIDLTYYQGIFTTL